MKNYGKSLGFNETICEIGEAVDLLHQLGSLSQALSGKKTEKLIEISKKLPEEFNDLTEREAYLAALLISSMELATLVSGGK